MDAIATADPGNRDYIASVAESLAWLADAERATGNYPAAIAARQRGVAVLERLFAQTKDVNYQQKLIVAKWSLGNLYADQGRTDLASDQYRGAVHEGELLLPKEPNNNQWTEYATKARVALATQYLVAGDMLNANTQTGLVCDASGKLMARDKTNPTWQGLVSACWRLRAKLADKNGSVTEAAQFAQRALDVAKIVRSGDRVADAFRIALSYGLLGDIQQKAGDAAAAKLSWTRALALLPAPRAEEPEQAGERSVLLRKLGREVEARQIASRLQALGYRKFL
jgi:Tfp pilus assembly protein PilF